MSEQADAPPCYTCGGRGVMELFVGDRYRIGDQRTAMVTCASCKGTRKQPPSACFKFTVELSIPGVEPTDGVVKIVRALVTERIGRLVETIGANVHLSDIEVLGKYAKPGSSTEEEA